MNNLCLPPTKKILSSLTSNCHSKKKTREIVHGLRSLLHHWSSDGDMPLTVCKWSARGRGNGGARMWSREEKRRGGGNGNSEYEEEGKRGKGWGVSPVNYSSSRQSNKLSTLPPPFPLFQLRMLKLSHQPWCRKHNSRSLPLDASRRDAMIRSIELDLRLEFSRDWGMVTKDGITKRRNWFAHERWKILFPTQKNSSRFDFKFSTERTKRNRNISTKLLFQFERKTFVFHDENGIFATIKILPLGIIITLSSII